MIDAAVVRVIEDVRVELQREKDQALLQHDLHKAEQALAGEYVCERIIRRLAFVPGSEVRVVRQISRAK